MEEHEADNTIQATMLGSMLFHRGVSGSRVVQPGKTSVVEGISFQDYGAHHNAYPHTYLTVAAAIGTEPKDIDEFISRLRKCLKEFVLQTRR